jgi:16S rRNA (cytidine1402-2'-O)-methyltransferase
MAGQGSLVVVGTPIGNLADLSPRAAEALRGAEVVACEDTRRTARLLRHAGAGVPMVAVHQHNEAARAADLVARMRAGARVALVSDAGMPLVSDPGARLVRAALDEGLAVEVVPGPSAVTAALAASGLAGEGGFAFLGFAPRRAAERRRLVERLARLDVPAVVFESPQRLPGLLADIAEALPDRPVAVCRELTKLHEEVVRGSAAEVARRLAQPVRGEVTLVVDAAPADATPDEARLREVLALLREAGLRPARAADLAAALGAAPRNRAYREALAARDASEGGPGEPH